MTDVQVIAHLEVVRSDLRDEIKRRIEGRNKYSIQLTTSLAAIIGVAFSRPEFLRVLIAAPLVAIYYTVLIVLSGRCSGSSRLSMSSPAALSLAASGRNVR